MEAGGKHRVLTGKVKGTEYESGGKGWSVTW